MFVLTITHPTHLPNREYAYDIRTIEDARALLLAELRDTVKTVAGTPYDDGWDAVCEARIAAANADGPVSIEFGGYTHELTEALS